MRVSIYDLRRTGPFLTLDFGIVCTTPNPGCETSFLFAAPTATAMSVYSLNSLQAQKVSDDTANGIRLIDPTANKEYWPVVDSQAQPDASQLPSYISDSLVHLAWVRFPAPPASVGAVDVTFPNGGPQVSGVPISSGPSKAPAPSSQTVAAGTARFSQPPDSTSTTGLTLPVNNLVLRVGNPNGSDTESGSHSTITLSADVLFKFDKSNLTPAASAIIGQVGSRIKAEATGVVAVTGYTDSIGTDAVNIPLSQARARSVVNALKPLVAGAPVSFQATGKGSADPVAPNTKPNGADNPAGRRLNRRVTVSFSVKAPTPPAPPPTTASSAPPAASGQTVAYQIAPSPATSPNSIDHYQVAFQSLHRDGDLAVLQLSVTCQTPASNSTACDGSEDFAGSSGSVPPIPASQNALTAEDGAAGGIYLFVPSTGDDYNPVTNDAGVELTADTTLEFGTSITYPLWVYFPAPPASATSAQVVLPGGTTRVTLPITAGPASP